MHAVDPQWEQRVIRNGAVADFHWNRWTDWPSGDPRWRIELIDTTGRPIEETAAAVASWVERTRVEGTPLSRQAVWWQ